jgi:hypothetical protein
MSFFNDLLDEDIRRNSIKNPERRIYVISLLVFTELNEQASITAAQTTLLMI